MLFKIDELRDDLRRSERKVADYVLANPSKTINESLTTLADAIGVSQPTVIRFCRAIGYEGFKDFKINLAQSLASNTRYFYPFSVVPEVTRMDPSTEQLHLLLQRLQQLPVCLRAAEISMAAKLLSTVQRVELYVAPQDQVLANNVHQKLLIAGKPGAVYADAKLHQQAVNLLESYHALVLIESGQNPDHTIAIIQQALGRRVAVLTVGLNESSKQAVGNDERLIKLNIPGVEETIAHLFRPLAVQLLLELVIKLYQDKERSRSAD